MTKASPPLQLFKRVMDLTPADVTLWKIGKHREKWKECVLLYVNEETLKVSGPGLASGIGLRAGQILAGLEKTPFISVFSNAIATGQPQEHVFHFGNEKLKVIESERRQYLVPFAQQYIGAFNTDVTLQIKAEQAKEEKVKHLEGLNQQLVERELAMIQLKSEIAELEGKLAMAA